jgi:hypothetical protein
MSRYYSTAFCWPPDTVHPVPWHGVPICSVCRRLQRHGRLSLYSGNTYCERHLNKALARSWRLFRRMHGLAATGCLPHEIREAAIENACKKAMP